MMTSNIYFCDYDVLTHYSSGMLNSKYKTDLTGKLIKLNMMRQLQAALKMVNIIPT